MLSSQRLLREKKLASKTIKKIKVDFDDKPNQLVSKQYRKLFLNGQFPFRIDHKPTGIILKWTLHKDAETNIQLESLDVDYYLPFLFDGLGDKNEHFAKIAQMAITDILTNIQKIELTTLRKCFICVRKSLLLKDMQIALRCISVLQQMADSSLGRLMLYFIATILPPLARIRNSPTVNCQRNNLVHDFNNSKTKTPPKQTLIYCLNNLLNSIENIIGEKGCMFIKTYIPEYQGRFKLKD